MLKTKEVQMKPLDMIRAYAEPNGHRHALSIFPCWGVTSEGVCECPKGTACTSPGKHPIPSNGLKAATRNIDQICQWWTAHPNANLGIPTGRANGLLVIDVDNGPEKHGEDNLMALEDTLERLPETWESLTGGGGRHLFFQYPEGLDVRNSTSKLAPNIDVRAEGGYVIAEPARHASGRIYAWETTHMPEDVPLAQLPMSWLNALTGSHTTPPAQKPVSQARFELPDIIPVGAAQRRPIQTCRLDARGGCTGCHGAGNAPQGEHRAVQASTAIRRSGNGPPLRATLSTGLAAHFSSEARRIIAPATFRKIVPKSAWRRSSRKSTRISCCLSQRSAGVPGTARFGSSGSRKRRSSYSRNSPTTSWTKPLKSFNSAPATRRPKHS